MRRPDEHGDGILRDHVELGWNGHDRHLVTRRRGVRLVDDGGVGFTERDLREYLPNVELTRSDARFTLERKSLPRLFEALSRICRTFSVLFWT